MKQVLVALAGPDSSGVVYTVTEELSKINCGVVDMSQTTLRNQFSSIMIVNNSDELSFEEIQKHVSDALDKRGLSMSVSVGPYVSGSGKITEGEPFVVTVDGSDSEGILLAFSRIFYESRSNIDSFRIIEEGAQAEGEKPKVLLVYEITVPFDIDRRAMVRTLSSIAKNHGMSMSMQHRHIFEAIHRVGIA